ncbi:MAG: hypothetical protein Q7T20_00410 [Saprospiraceae bacterium]|nr:hypothetical protein [Saprospiraceae bacterium]
MKQTMLLILIIGLSACQQDLGINFNFPSCDSPNRVINARTVDFYTKEVVPNIKLQIYAHPTLSLWGPYVQKEFTTDENGLASTTFENQEITSYYVQVLPSPDTSYIYPWQLLVKYDCEKNWLIMMKPVQILNLTIKNNGPMAWSKRFFFVTRVGPAETSAYLNHDISGDYSFGQIKVDTIPVGFEEKFMVKVVPEEQVQISYNDSSNSFKAVKFLTDKSNISYYTITL